MAPMLLGLGASELFSLVRSMPELRKAPLASELLSLVSSMPELRKAPPASELFSLVSRTPELRKRRPAPSVLFSLPEVRGQGASS